MKYIVGNAVFFTVGNIALVQLVPPTVVMVHLASGGKISFAADDGEALWEWAKDGAENLHQLHPPSGEMKEAAKSHAYDWNGKAA